jgi:hypothetical protein
MLPVTLQFIIAMVAYALNERMARRVDYLQEEVWVLKEALAAATGKNPFLVSTPNGEVVFDEPRFCGAGN